MRTKQIRLVGTVTSHDEAVIAVQQQPGDAALVVRGAARALVLNCPCRCGDSLTINLDGRAGPAWRFYLRKNALTLFPSYWRDSRCQSHFILWGNHIYWCDHEEWWSSEVSVALRQTVWEHLTAEFSRYDILAEKIGDIPWEVLDACRALVREGRAERHPDKRRGDEFRRKGF
ncbi:MAG: hypothetical protein JWN25_2570 [Verrucomicrobiales bacterium]|nr:hypothetical protein [Verrucomicrobiales bacterium]